MSDKGFLDIREIEAYNEFRFDDLIIGFEYSFIIYDFFHPEERVVSKGDSRSADMGYYIYECMLDTAPKRNTIESLLDIKTGFPIRMKFKQNFSVKSMRNAIGRYFAAHYEDRPPIIALSGTQANIKMVCSRSTKKKFIILKLEVYTK